jgi:hypothetical protein
MGYSAVASGFNWNSGTQSCETISPPSSSEPETPNYTMNYIPSTRRVDGRGKITLFTELPIENDLLTLKNVIVKFNLVNGGTDSFNDFAIAYFSIVSSTTLEIELEFLREEYDEEFTMEITNLDYTMVHEGNTINSQYSERKFVIRETKFKPFFDQSPSTQDIIDNSVDTVSSYGVVATIFASPGVVLLMSINFVKLVSIIPIKIPLYVQSFLKVFSKFVEVDHLNKSISDPLFSEKEFYTSEFRPKNQIFRFNSIYLRQRALFIILRIGLNIAFVFWILTKKRSARNKIGDKSTEHSRFKKLMS